MALELSRRQFSNYLLGAGLSIPASQMGLDKIPPVALSVGLKYANRELDLESDITSLFEIENIVVPVGERYVNSVGVNHSSEFFKKNRKEIVRAVNDSSSFVVLEYFSPEARQIALPNTLDDVILNEDSFEQGTHAATSFYASVARECARTQKDIITVNPQSFASDVLESYLLMGHPLGAFFADKAASNEGKQTKRISRRNFLKLASLVPSSLAFASWADIFEGSGRWNQTDWRDVCSAQAVEVAIDMYQTELPKGSMIYLFQGLAHSGATAEYISNPVLREEKDKLYSIHNRLSDLTARRFTFNPTANSWELVDQFQYK